MRLFEVGDSIAFALIGLLGFVLTGVGLVFHRLLRREKNPPKDGVDWELLSEDDDGAPRHASSGWERPPDWWRREG